MLLIQNAIKSNQYRRLIEYAYTRCDMFTLRVPTHVLEEDNEFRVDINNKLEIIEPFIIKKYSDCEYFCSIGGDSVIYVVSLDKRLNQFLQDAGDLYHWEYPRSMPEDLCFISNGECWLESIAHEELCRIFTQSAAEIDLLKWDIGFDFIEIECDTPLFKL